MPVETATYISDLNASNPAHSDPLSAGDAHMRLIKAALKATFPNINGAMTATPAALSAVGTPGSSGAPSVNFGAATEGFYQKSAGQVGITGQIVGNGAKVVGELCHFAIPPTSLKSGGDATATKYQYLELDGGNYLAATYPELYAAGVASGAWSAGTTFTLPNCYATGRFLRSRQAAVPLLTTQGNRFLEHNHPASFAGNAVLDHTHANTFNDVQHSHVLAGGAGSTGTSFTSFTQSTISTTGSGNNYIQSSFTGCSITNAAAGAHTPSGAVTVSNTGVGSTETRPEALSVIVAIKT